jgi:hypothetical protein
MRNSLNRTGFVTGDRVWIKRDGYWKVGPYGGLWATVAKDDLPDSSPLTHIIVDGAACLAGYSVKSASLVKGSRSTVVAIRPRGVVAKYGE